MLLFALKGVMGLITLSNACIKDGERHLLDYFGLLRFLVQFKINQYYSRIDIASNSPMRIFPLSLGNIQVCVCPRYPERLPTSGKA